MATIIKVASILGKDLRTRAFFHRDILRLTSTISGEIVLDFSNVIFISRSVADEIFNMQNDIPRLRLSGMHGEVEAMYRIVRNARTSKRVYPAGSIKVLHLQNLKEMSAYFASF